MTTRRSISQKVAEALAHEEYEKNHSYRLSEGALTEDDLDCAAKAIEYKGGKK